MTQAQIGFLRGAGYAALTGLVYYVSTHLAGSGILPNGITAVVLAILGSLEHYLNDSFRSAFHFYAVTSSHSWEELDGCALGR